MTACPTWFAELRKAKLAAIKMRVRSYFSVLMKGGRPAYRKSPYLALPKLGVQD